MSRPSRRGSPGAPRPSSRYEEISSVPTGTARLPLSAIASASRSARRAPRRTIPTRTTFAAPLLRSTISCAIRLTERAIAAASSASAGLKFPCAVIVLRSRLRLRTDCESLAARLRKKRPACGRSRVLTYTLPSSYPFRPLCGGVKAELFSNDGDRPVKLTCVTLHRRACGLGYSEPCVDNPLLLTRHLLIN